MILTCSEEYHGGFRSTDVHPACDFGDPSQFGDLDPEGQYVVSTRIRCGMMMMIIMMIMMMIRCGRSVQGFPFNPNMTEAQYSDLEVLVSSTLQVRQGE